MAGRDQYQSGYSKLHPNMADPARAQKGNTIVQILREHLGRDEPLLASRCLDVGCSAGLVTQVVAQEVELCVGTDIDTEALRASCERGLDSPVACADATALPFRSRSFDIVICNHVYEHVHSPVSLFSEIRRVLRDNGVCYLAAGNRLWPMEPHHKIPFLSYLPRPLADALVRRFRSEERYHERFKTRIGIEKLLRDWTVTDYTQSVLREPAKYGLSTDGHIDQSRLLGMARYAPRFVVRWLSATWLFVIEPK